MKSTISKTGVMPKGKTHPRSHQHTDQRRETAQRIAERHRPHGGNER